GPTHVSVPGRTRWSAPTPWLLTPSLPVWEDIHKARVNPSTRGERSRDDVFELGALFLEAGLQAGISRKLPVRGRPHLARFGGVPEPEVPVAERRAHAKHQCRRRVGGRHRKRMLQ